MQADLIAEKNFGMDKDKIRKAISKVKLEVEAYHERNIEILTQEVDDYRSSWKGDAVGLNALTNQVIREKLPLNAIKNLQQEKSQSKTLQF